MPRLPALAVTALIAAGCTDLSQPWELDHARVLAVRLSTPGLVAGDTATVDALVSDDRGVPRVLIPSGVQIVGAGADALTVAGDGGVWTVTAGSQAAIDALRASEGVAADAPAIVTLATAYVDAGVALVATKQVRLGVAGVNPPSPSIAIDGVVGATAPVAVGKDVALTLTGLDGVADLAYDWLTSTGELTRSETPAATLVIATDDPRTGQLAAVVRDDAGGVAWATSTIAAE